MSSGYFKNPARALRVFCPVAGETLARMLRGDAGAMEHDDNLSEMMKIIRNSGSLGDFGIYRSVMEISPGYEVFTPGAQAIPTLGEPGARATSPTAVLTIFFPADAPTDAVDKDIAAILDAHPWESPVVELIETTLLSRQLP